METSRPKAGTKTTRPTAPSSSSAAASSASSGAKRQKRDLTTAVDLDPAAIEKYARGATNLKTKQIKFKGLRLTMEREQERIIKAATETAAVEILLPAEPGYISTAPATADNGDEDESGSTELPVYKLKQRDIVGHVDLNTAKNQFELQLQNFGPYNLNYSSNGRHLLFGGRRGHIAILDCITMQVGMELQLQDEVHDVRFLHNESMFAVAQKECTYIYDSKGAEIHALHNHSKPYRLDFLPYHFLLVSTGQSGWIKWQDITTGECVGSYTTGLGSCNVLKHNPQNAVSHLGHKNGVVTLWSPTSSKPLASMFCHKAPITDLAIDRGGTYMATAGYDGMMKIWDLRMYRSVHGYQLDGPGMSLDISDSGLLGVSIGRNVQILRDPFSKPSEMTYLKHEIRTPNAALSSGGGAAAATRALKSSVSVNCVRFRPLEDVLGCGHSHGISTIIVPGAGEANYDAYEANPFRTLKQRREQEVQNLLTKLSPQMIALDSKFVGTVDKDFKTLQEEHKEIFSTANATMRPTKPKNKMRGKNKIAAKLRRKQKNVIDEQTVKLKEMLAQQREDKAQNPKTNNSGSSKSTKSPSSPASGSTSGSVAKATAKASSASAAAAASYDPLRRFDKKK